MIRCGLDYEVGPLRKVQLSAELTLKLVLYRTTEIVHGLSVAGLRALDDSEN